MDTQLIIGIVVGFLLLIGIMNVNKKVKKNQKVAGFSKNLVMVSLVILMLGALYLGGVGGLIPNSGLESPLAAAGGAALAAAPGAVQTVPSTSTCPPGSVEDVTVTLASVDIATTVATGGTHRYKVGDNPAQTVSDAGTFTASGGDTLSILWYNASTSGGYYSDISTFNLDCSRGTQTISRELYNNGTLTLNVFNEEGNIITGSENETLAAGDVVTLNAEIKGAFQKGAPYGGVVIAMYNSTEIDDVIVDFNDAGDAIEINLPSVFTINSTAFKAKAYFFPAVIGNAILTGSVVIDSDDTINPSYDSDVILELRPYNYFINEDNKGSFDVADVEDEDDVATIAQTVQTTVNID